MDSDSGKLTPFGKAGIIAAAGMSPNGKNLLVTTIHKPFSYLHSAGSFPREIEVWDVTGKPLYKVASVPLEDKVPMNGVMTGPRSVMWRPSEAATLIWVEALDGGDLRNNAPFRDLSLIHISLPPIRAAGRCSAQSSPAPPCCQSFAELRG